MLGDEYQDQGLIFPGEKGQPIRPWTLTRKLQRMLERVALPHIRFHDLHHTWATLLLGKGVHSKFVQEHLGHAKISITLDTYSHVIPAMGDQTRKAIGDILRNLSLSRFYCCHRGSITMSSPYFSVVFFLQICAFL